MFDADQRIKATAFHDGTNSREAQRLKLVALLLAFFGLAIGMSAQAFPTTSSITDEASKCKFQIVGCHAPLWEYTRDKQWVDFSTKGTLGRCVLGDDDIACYDWNDQALVLTEEASKRFFSLPPFVVMLGDKRLYGGICLDVMAPCGADHPVLYTQHRDKQRQVLLLRPNSQTLFQKPDFQDPAWKIMALAEMKEHFKAKLRVSADTAKTTRYNFYQRVKTSPSASASACNGGWQYGNLAESN